MVPVASTADGEAVPARPYQICGCDDSVGVARWVPEMTAPAPYSIGTYWSIDECLSCGASWISYPLEDEQP